jgi:hypothetical protein
LVATIQQPNSLEILIERIGTPWPTPCDGQPRQAIAAQILPEILLEIVPEISRATPA